MLIEQPQITCVKSFYLFYFLCLHAGSGYSILNELEQHLAMTGSTQHDLGQETLEEDEAKRQFFAELEGNNTSSLNYSELNRQLGSTATSLPARFI